MSRYELNLFVSVYALIVDLDLDRFLFTVDDAIDFVRQLNKLKKFVFSLKNDSECDHFLRRLNEVWKCIWHHKIKTDRYENNRGTIHFCITLIR